jgi:hypothetical protein
MRGDANRSPISRILAATAPTIARFDDLADAQHIRRRVDDVGGWRVASARASASRIIRARAAARPSGRG